MDHSEKKPEISIEKSSQEVCQKYHLTNGNETLFSLLDDPHFSKLYVVGGPGTGKTRFLTRSAVKFAKSMEKNVLCVMPNEKIYKAFLREFGKRRMDSEWPQCFNEPGVIVTLEDLDANLAEEPTNVLKRCRLLIGHLGHQFFQKILELSNWHYDVVVIDDIVFISKDRYYAMLCAGRKREFVLVAAYDWHQDKEFKERNSPPSFAEFVQTERTNKCDHSTCTGKPAIWTTHMNHSNRPDASLKWISLSHYVRQLKGRTDRPQATIQFVDVQLFAEAPSREQAGSLMTAWNQGEAKIAVGMAEELLKEGTSADNIFIIADFEPQIELIRRLVHESKICKEVRVGSPFDFRWTPMVRNVIYTNTVSRRLGCWGCFKPAIGAWISVLTRAYGRVIWIGNSEMLAEHNWLSVRNFLKFLNGEEMEENKRKRGRK
ncbi:unnamed protein product [Caenorhabditis sp. 36 PRJEB53466]|nr:unnamed protein product [Caenorhabditis sp. 36 PRJEB53466]